MPTTAQGGNGPAGRILDHLRDREQGLLVEGPADELETQRQALPVEPRRDRDTRKAGHVHRHGEHVVEIHLHGSAEAFSPMPKAEDGVAGVRIASIPAA